VAKRLQERARGGQTLLSRATYELLDGIPARRLARVRLPGRKEPITPYVIEADGIAPLPP
jgi:class 3 adenylate cyclase